MPGLGQKIAMHASPTVRKFPLLPCPNSHIPSPFTSISFQIHTHTHSQTTALSLSLSLSLSHYSLSLSLSLSLSPLSLSLSNVMQYRYYYQFSNKLLSVFTRMSCDSYRTRFRSLLLCPLSVMFVESYI